MRCKCCNRVMETSSYRVNSAAKLEGIIVEEDMCMDCRYQVRYCGDARSKWYTCENIKTGVTPTPNYGLDYESDEFD